MLTINPPGHPPLSLFHYPLLHPGAPPAGPPCCPPSSTGARSRKSLSSMLLSGAPSLLRPWMASQIKRTLGRSNGLSPSPYPQQLKRPPVFVLPPFAGRVPQKFTSISPLPARTTGFHKRFLPRTKETVGFPSRLSRRVATRLCTMMLWSLGRNR